MSKLDSSSTFLTNVLGEHEEKMIYFSLACCLEGVGCEMVLNVAMLTFILAVQCSSQGVVRESTILTKFICPF